MNGSADAAGFELHQSNLLASLVKAEFQDPIDSFQDIIVQRLKLYVSKSNIIPH